MSKTITVPGVPLSMDLDDFSESGYEEARQRENGNIRKNMLRESLEKMQIKGGKGSGFFGHAGRIGKVGGSAPASGGRFDLRSITDIVVIENAVRGRKKEILDGVREGLRLIDSVHNAGDSQHTIFVKTITSSVSASARIVLDTRTLKTLRIEVNQRNSEISVSDPENILHEMGHYFTLSSDGKIPQTPETTFALKNLEDTIKQTQGYKKLEDMLLHPSDYEKLRLEPGMIAWVGDSDNRTFLRYLMQPRELYARAYSQYILTKTKHQGGLQSIARDALISTPSGFDSERTPNGYKLKFPVQWEANDFLPVSQAYDALFKSAGWLK